VRILISTPFLGGSGGIERHVASTIACLGERHELDVCAKHVSSTGYVVRPDRCRILPPESGRRWRRARRDAYDAYLHYQHADDVQDRFDVGVRMVIPCGDDVRHLEDRFDAVLLEAPDNQRFVADPAKAVLFPPPLQPMADRSEAVAGVPPDFFLTVFNPHHPRKGLADLREVAPRSPVPVVWCRSSRFRLEDAPEARAGIVALEDCTQEQLRFLYERCRAYISFDQNQGFGWSLADALQYGAPTLSRGRGVMSLPGLDRTGCAVYDSNDELVRLLEEGDFIRTHRDLGDLTPGRFVERFEGLVRVLQVVRSSHPRTAGG
jgi:hypothetical protein